MTTIWNDRPPAAPPTTSDDPCTTWPQSGDPGAATTPHPSYAPHLTPAWSPQPPIPPPPPPPSSPPPSARGGGARVVLASLGVGGLIAAGWLARGAVDPPVATPASTTPSTITSSPFPGLADEPVAAVAATLEPSVVQIGNGRGLGSGVVYDAGGLILTNAHVVGDAASVEVHLRDGSTVEGDVLGADVATDIAVVRVKTDRALVPARLATTAPVVGQLTVAVGSPFGLERTVTAGVVSAVNRPVDNEAGVVVGMIQTDAPINPGNSGGALANRRAEVIGINTMIFSQSGENNGIGFAIPIEKAKAVADKIVNGESLARAWLGVAGQAASTSMPGAAVGQIEPGSPAAEAGLRPGDVVTAVEGTEIRAFGDLAVAVGNRSPGERVVLTVRRGADTLTVEVTLGTRRAR